MPKIEIVGLHVIIFFFSGDFSDKSTLWNQHGLKEYCNYMNEAKREVTKISRLEKITPMIIELKGLHDKYKNC